MEGPPVKRKRGRPCKKKPGDQQLTIKGPQSETITDLEGLNYGFQIFKEVMNLPKLKPFLEQPNKNLYGLQNYYEVIKKPIWLQEVSRKFTCSEYKHLAEFVSDMKLLITNGYTFWGPHHKFARIGRKIEQIFEQQLMQLPERVKKTINNWSDSQSHEAETIVAPPREEQERKIYEPSARDCTSESVIDTNELLRWEKEVLVNKQHAKQIRSFWMLPEIGQFIGLIKQILEFNNISQCEIERMLLMPKESSTLAQIMTAMLCPYAVRGNLCLMPIMYYEVWSEMLRRKVDRWFNIYYKYVDPLEVFYICGIEPIFWAAMGPVNPLSESGFHELTFYQRVWLLKALCCHTYHSNKRIEVAFNVVEESCLRPHVLGGDSLYQYFNLFSPEIRVYRQKKSHGDTEMLDGNEAYSTFNADEFKFSGKTKYSPPLSAVPRKKSFHLVADSLESLNELIDSLKKKKSIVTALEKLKNKQHDEITLKGLSSLYKQWQDFKNRSETSIIQSMDFWLNRNSYCTSESNDGESNDLQNSALLQDLGKRIQRRKVSSIVNEVCLSGSEHEETDGSNSSDWEARNIKRKSRRKTLINTYKVKTCQRKLIYDPRRKNIHPVQKQLFLGRNLIVEKAQQFGVTISKKNISQDKSRINIANAAVPNDSITVTSKMNKLDTNDVLTISLKCKDKTLSHETPTAQEMENSLSPESVSISLLNPTTSHIFNNPTANNNSITTNNNNKIQASQDVPNNNCLYEPDNVTIPNINYCSFINNNNYYKSRTTNDKNHSLSPGSLSNYLPIDVGEQYQMCTLSTDSERLDEEQQNSLSLSPVHFDDNFLSESVCQELLSIPMNSNCSKVQGNIVIRTFTDGSFGYAVKLPDGGIINISYEETLKVQTKNGGIMPKIVSIPVVQLSTLSPIYSSLQETL